MGAAPSKVEEDKALQLCRGRKKFVRQALDGRCSLAVTHITYIDALRDLGTALMMFVELGPEVPIESSRYTSSTTATPEPLALTETSLSHFNSRRMNRPIHYHSNHMKSRDGPISKKIEEKLPTPVIGSVISSSSQRNNVDASSPLWDYFGPSHPIDSHLSFGNGLNQDLDIADEIRRLRKEEGIPDLEDEEDNHSFEKEDSHDSEDEFDEPSTDTLVRSFVNRATEHVDQNGDNKRESPDLSPLTTASTSGNTFHNHNNNNNNNNVNVKNVTENRAATPKDLFSSVKDIEYLFVKAAESGRDVPRMLEANKFHFRPVFPGKDTGSMTLMMVKACFSCGKDPAHVQEEPVQNTVKYLTWHRTASSRSSSSLNTLGPTNAIDEVEDFTSNLLQNCMISGSHASTLDRLFAWERKLYDEVKASKIVRGQYDAKCKLLRQLESMDESKTKSDKVRAVVKDLHSRIGVAIHRINTISKKIEELRDNELQPQLEELIEGLRKMWEVMLECHNLQFNIISAAYNKSNSRNSANQQRQAAHLKSQLDNLCSSFTKWFDAQRMYLQSLNGWLQQCITLQEQSKRRKRGRREGPRPRDYGPPIYTTIEVWLELILTLPDKAVTDSIKGLASEINCFLPNQDSHNKQTNVLSSNNNNDAHSNLSDPNGHGFDRFHKALAGFLSQLSIFAEASVNTFIRLQKEIQNAKNNYNHRKSLPRG
ncbi:protein ROLLING AND ERECT LEAF 2-like [Impatiens glandulifera]|uniref:protein ROLLING AND ERECT LEAF 2-like n=1 Tax=Impatiens glandulifera TaxID=253017 RepID=UPI001FB10864|nr:protein ROLLING AND ERECT LEAF 2-like [Impatiens glandulifera]